MTDAEFRARLAELLKRIRESGAPGSRRPRPARPVRILVKEHYRRVPRRTR